ncbi:MAG: PAS domain-containing protein [Ruminococcaceae bacterium]|nr:PAS domain-containing protein [Oscillospiraceae bacterium]
MEKRIFRTILAVSGAIILSFSAASIILAAILLSGGDLVRTIVCTLILAVILMTAAILAASRLTSRIMRPILPIFTEIDDGTDTEIYPECKAVLDKIKLQEIEISRQLARVDNEKNRLSAIINNMDEGLIILDNDLRVLMLNESAYSWLGTTIPRAECAGRTMEEICESGEICKCIEQADSIRLTLDGRHLQLHVNYVGSSAEQIGRIGLLLDVTERTQIERIKQEFTANVSHELKTPLTSISGYAELIESGMAEGQDALLFAGRIRRESTRMLALISDIIKLSKLDETPEEDEFEQTSLRQICENCLDMLEMSAKRHEVELSVAGEDVKLLGSPSQLTELVYNLVDNGIRYNHPGGAVRIRIEPAPPEKMGAIAMLCVSDTGIGISKEHQTRIFERFYRVDKSRSKETGGTGLGLAIVKHVAERHHAKIEIDSRIDEGTTIRVLFYEYWD